MTFKASERQLGLLPASDVLQLALVPLLNSVCLGTSLVVQWLRLCLPMQGVWVRSPVRELRSHMARDQKNQNIKQKQYCNKFNKTFKMVHIKKKNLKKKNSSCLSVTLYIMTNRNPKRICQISNSAASCFPLSEIQENSSVSFIVCELSLVVYPGYFQKLH